MNFKKIFGNWLSRDNVSFMRKYEIDLDAMDKIKALSNRQYELYKDLLSRIGRNCNQDDLIVEATYNDFGYNKPQQFYRDRKALVDAELIYFESNIHILNPTMLRYPGRKQWIWMQSFYNKKADLTHILFGLDANGKPLK